MKCLGLTWLATEGVLDCTLKLGRSGVASRGGLDLDS